MKTIIKFLSHLFFRRLTRGASILMYHSIDTQDAFFNVLPSEFEKQMKYLHDQGLQVINLSTLVKLFLEKKDVSGFVCLTFDDGYQSLLHNALPVLERYHFSATIFISPKLLGTSFVTSDHVQLEIMTIDEYRKIAASGFHEFLSHGLTHRELPTVSNTEVANELDESSQFLGVTTPKILAYPRGKYSESVLSVLHEKKWDAAVTTNPGVVTHASQNFLLPRNFVGRSTFFWEFKMLVSDGVFYYAKLRSWYTNFFKKS